MTSLLQTAFPRTAVPDQPGVASAVKTHAPVRLTGDGSADVGDIWRILRHRRGWIAAVTALLMGATLAYGLLTPSLYSATAQLIVDPRDRQVVNNDVNPSSVSPDGGIAQVESQVSVVQSTGVLTRAVRATDLTDDAEFNGSGPVSQAVSRFAALFGYPTAKDPAAVEARTLDDLRRVLSVKRADKVLVIDATVTTRSAEKSARLANAIAAAYLADQASARADAADAASAALKARLDEQRQRVKDADDAVETYRLQHNLVVATGQLVSERQLADVNDQLLAAQSRVTALKAKVDQIRQARSGGLSADSTAEAVGSAVIAKLREQESALDQREADLNTELGPRHPSIAVIDMQVRRVRQSIRAELDRLARSVQADYDRAVSNAHDFAARLDTLKSQTLANDQTSVHLQELLRERDAVRSVYANYLVRVQETREQANVDSTNARVISTALPPQQRSWPPLGLLIGGALCCGLGLGAALALIAEYIRPTLLSSAQAEAAAGAPVVGVIPLAATRRRRFSLRRRGHRGGAVGDLSSVALPPGTQEQAVMALRRLFGVERGEPKAGSIVMVSAEADAAARENIAQLLAVTASRQGERVLFIDADLAGGQHSTTPGLLDVLRGECSLESVLQFDGGRRIAILNKGCPSAVERHSVERTFAGRMLADACKLFDLVIIDGGNATQNSRLAPLVQVARQICMVAQLAVTPQTDVEAACEAMLISGKAVSAVLLASPERG